MSEPLNGAELLARIRPRLAEEATEICLRPDLIDEFREAEAALTEEIANRGGGRLGDKPVDHTDAAQRVRDLEEQIQAASVTFRFRALPKAEFRALCDDHPPRKGDEMDHMVGYNRTAVLDALVRSSLYDPVFDDASWAEFLDTVSTGEWEELRSTANSVNRGVVEPPKSGLASRILSQRDADSRLHAPGE